MSISLAAAKKQADGAAHGYVGGQSATMTAGREGKLRRLDQASRNRRCSEFCTAGWHSGALFHAIRPRLSYTGALQMLQALMGTLSIQ